MSTYDFSTLYTTLSYNLFKDTLIDLIERTFNREGMVILNVCDALTFLLDNIFVRFCTRLYRQVVWIPMGTNCAPPVVDLFPFCYQRDFMMSLSDDKQADIIDAFNTTFSFLDDVLNVNNV